MPQTYPRNVAGVRVTLADERRTVVTHTRGRKWYAEGTDHILRVTDDQARDVAVVAAGHWVRAEHIYDPEPEPAEELATVTPLPTALTGYARLHTSPPPNVGPPPPAQPAVSPWAGPEVQVPVPVSGWGVADSAESPYVRLVPATTDEATDEPTDPVEQAKREAAEHIRLRAFYFVDPASSPPFPFPATTDETEPIDPVEQAKREAAEHIRKARERAAAARVEEAGLAYRSAQVDQAQAMTDYARAIADAQQDLARIRDQAA